MVDPVISGQYLYSENAILVPVVRRGVIFGFNIDRGELQSKSVYINVLLSEVAVSDENTILVLHPQR